MRVRQESGTFWALKMLKKQAVLDTEQVRARRY